MNLTKHEPQYHPRNTPMGQLEYLTNIWDEVCYEQERNEYDWEATKAKLLSDWNSYESMPLDYWMAYVQESILLAAKDVVRESRANG